MVHLPIHSITIVEIIVYARHVLEARAAAVKQTDRISVFMEHAV